MHAKPTGPQRWTRHLSAGGFLGGASLAVVLLSSWLGAGAREASGYVFYPVNYYTGSPGARPAVLWSPDVWAPGQTLSVTLVDSPEWKRAFGSTANAVRFLDREVLGAWSAIETADIRWEIGRVAGEDEAFGETDTYVYRGKSTYAWTCRDPGGENRGVPGLPGRPTSESHGPRKPAEDRRCRASRVRALPRPPAFGHDYRPTLE